MQAYATAERPARGQRLRILDSKPEWNYPLAGPSPSEPTLLDQLLGRLADLVAERIIESAGADPSGTADWMDARSAAAYLGIHRDTLRKLAAQRAIPVHQDGPRCKLYFRRDELDAWRQSSPGAQLRVVS